MQTKKLKQKPQVHILTKQANMKFIPETYERFPDTQSSHISSGVSNKLKSFFGFARDNKNNKISDKSDRSCVSASDGFLSSVKSSQISETDSKRTNYKFSSLKFAEKISAEYFLIGNQHQLDLIGIGNITENNYVDSEYLWSLKFKKCISHVIVDNKKMNVLAIIVDKTLKIYKYDSKKLTKEPFNIFKEIDLSEIPFSMLMAKDGNICIFYKKSYEIYVVGEEVRKKLAKKYEIPRNVDENNFEILAVPEPFQNILNIFFAEEIENENIFSLWGIQLEFLALQIHISPAYKVYDIKKFYRNSMTMINYSRDVYLINLKSEILAVKRGYVLDSASINMDRGQHFLKYMGNDSLLHISKTMIEVYNFSLNTQVKPSRIQITPKDSVKFSSDLTQFSFFKILMVPNNDFSIIYQVSPENNRNKNGEIQYFLFVTRSITREQKINELFPSINWKICPNSVDFYERFGMAQKMGLTTKQIYLELWNRTQKCQKEDYQILIATKDYQTIKDQVLRKLRKASMSFKQIQTIEKQCFDILKGRIFNSTCTEQSVLEYISCHFFLRKLEMFKYLQLMKRQEKKEKNISSEKKEEKTSPEKEDKNSIKKKEDDNKIIKMTIRQYQNLRAMQIKVELINLVGLFCHEGKKSAIQQIRFLLRSFKFVFRTIYYEILEKIIIKAEGKLIDLLQAIPQLLPYTPSLLESVQYGAPNGYFQGIWPKISLAQWRESLFVDGITTIDNKQIILQKVIKSLSFRRNWLSQHDMVTISKKDIEINSQKIKQEQTFYYFIAKMFKHLNDSECQKTVIIYLQQTYELMPIAIRRKVFLIERIYSFLEGKNLLPEINNRTCTLSQFLKLQDSEFIRHCFVQERSIKGLILKYIKPLYEQICGNEGKAMFNDALLKYFTSELSEISDLKYILNRINNQKRQFHRQNQQMYEVLVEALQRKLKIGTGKDIPINQVLVYLQNIPLKSNSNPANQSNKALHELRLIENIKQQVQNLQTARVNMSIYDILHFQDQVITKLITHQVDENKIFSPENYQLTAQSRRRVQNLTYAIIANIQTLSEQIYEKKNSYKIFFIYLAKLCEDSEMIKHVQHLLQNQPLQQCYDEATADSLVQYMYRWKMSEQKIMVQNQQYVTKLLELIPKQSVTYIYLQSQMKYAEMLSGTQQMYQYPITQEVYTITDLKDELRSMPAQSIMKLNLQKLHEIIHQMQKIYLEARMEDQEVDQDQIPFSVLNFISLHQLYEIVIVELLHARKLKEVLPYIRKIMQLDINDTTYNIVYPLLYIIQICHEINDSNKHALVNCISYFFYDPWTLLETIEQLAHKKINTHEIHHLLDSQLAKGKQKSMGYNKENKVFSSDYLDFLGTKSFRQNFMNILEKTTKNMQALKEEFRDVKFAAIMAMLCNEPYALAKFISCSGRLNVSAIRCFLSYAIKQAVFDPLSILQLGRRIFLILLESEKNKEPIEQIIQKYTDVGLDEQIQLNYICQDQDRDSLKIWWKSAEAFSKKKNIVKQNQRNLKITEQNKQRKSDRIRSSLEGQQDESSDNKPYEYPFADDDNDVQDIVDFRNAIGHKKGRNALKFDANIERSRALQKNRKGHLFHSTLHDVPRVPQLSMSIRGYQAKTSPKSYLTSINPNSRMEPDKQPYFVGSDLTESKEVIDFTHSYNIPSFTESRDKLTEDKPQFNDEINQLIEVEPEMRTNSVIQIKQQYDQNSFSEEVMNSIEIKHHIQPVQSQNISPSTLAEQLIQINQAVLISKNYQSNVYNFSSLEKYNTNKQILAETTRELYRQKSDNITINSLFHMIQQLGREFPHSDICQDGLAMLIKVIQNQQKIISEIPFYNIFPAEHLLDQFIDKRQIFNIIQSGLSKYIDSENIHQIGLFVRRTFYDANLQGQITWEFVLSLCQKIDSIQEQEVAMNLQKIQITLIKVKIRIWIKKFDKFVEKVLQSKYKEKLLTIFCDYLINAVPRADAQEFLNKLSKVDSSEIIQSTLKQLS